MLASWQHQHQHSSHHPGKYCLLRLLSSWEHYLPSQPHYAHLAPSYRPRVILFPWLRSRHLQLPRLAAVFQPRVVGLENSG